LFVFVRNVRYLVLTRQYFTEKHITCIGLAIIIDVRHILMHTNNQYDMSTMRIV